MSPTRRLYLTLLLASCGGPSDLPDPTLPADPDAEQRADLSAGPIEAPARLRLDSLLEMRVGVRNSGTRTAGPGWVVRVFLSPDQVIDPGDTQIDQFVTTRELGLGASDRYLRNKKLAGGVGPGRYYIGSILDVTEVVPELAESNNVLTAPRTITLTPEPTTPPEGN